MTNDSRNDFLVPASILLSGILIAGSIFYSLARTPMGEVGTTPNPSPAPQEEAPVEVPEVGSRDVILGDPKATVAVIEYGDYQCPFCARFHEQVGKPLREDYIKSGKVKMVFRNFQFLGPESIAAAEAAECAKDQSKFWLFHDALYDEETRDGQEHNGNLNRAFFLKTAQNLKLDVATFTSCIDSHKYQQKVQSDTAEAQTVGVNSTPTSFVNGQKVAGALPYDQFKALVESQLK